MQQVQHPCSNKCLSTFNAHHHFWYSPVGVHSAKRRYQSPEWRILSHIDCFIQGEVFWISGPT